MGTRVPQSLMDYPRFQLDLGLRCRTCGRTSVFDVRDVLVWAQREGRSAVLPFDASRFRCRCRSRDVEAIAVSRSERPKPLPPRERLEPIYVQAAGLAPPCGGRPGRL